MPIFGSCHSSKRDKRSPKVRNMVHNELQRALEFSSSPPKTLENPLFNIHIYRQL